MSLIRLKVLHSSYRMCECVCVSWIAEQQRTALMTLSKPGSVLWNPFLQYTTNTGNYRAKIKNATGPIEYLSKARSAILHCGLSCLYKLLILILVNTIQQHATCSTHYNLITVGLPPLYMPPHSYLLHSQSSAVNQLKPPVVDFRTALSKM